MNSVSAENKEVAKTVVKVFGESPKITRFWDEKESCYIDIAEFNNCPKDKTISYSTIGLSDTFFLKDGGGNNMGVEIIGASYSSNNFFANIISTASFCIKKDGWVCKPGSFFPDIVEMYYPSIDMKHLLFISPPPFWKLSLETLYFDTKTVAWLFALPISESEYKYIEKNGSDKFEDILEASKIDIFNIKRIPVV